MVTKTATPLRGQKSEAPVRTARCQHYWMIDPAEGRLSRGQCLLCGEQRDFPNYLTDCLIDNDREKFEEWVAVQGRKAKKARGNWDVLSEPGEGV